MNEKPFYTPNVKFVDFTSEQFKKSIYLEKDIKTIGDMMEGTFDLYLFVERKYNVMHEKIKIPKRKWAGSSQIELTQLVCYQGNSFELQQCFKSGFDIFLTILNYKQDLQNSDITPINNFINSFARAMYFINSFIFDKPIGALSDERKKLILSCILGQIENINEMDLFTYYITNILNFYQIKFVL